MGLLSPNLPDVDLEDWRRRPFRARLEVMSKHWVEHGFGSPPALLGIYVVKILLYAFAGLAIVSATTPGIGGLSEIATWWAEPIVFQKLVLWTLLFEVLGFGCGFGALTGHFNPPMGGFLYWLRPGTIRLPPWPGRVPLTSGDRRTPVDVALYAALLVLGVRALLAPELTASVLAPVAVLVPLLGLRDKTIFLAARAEHYWVTLLVFFFPADVIAGSMAVMIAIWWGAATSKLNHHFPSVVATMISNSPLRPRRLKRALYRDAPEDLRPSRLAAGLAHFGTVIEYSVPLVLLLTGSGPVKAVAVGIMVVFHLHILSTIPMGVPMEWNVFFMYATVALFGVHGDVSVFSISSPLLVVILVVALIGMPVLGNIRPHLISFLPSMRYYAGNWPMSLWLYRPEALEAIDEHVTKAAPITERQLATLYDEATSEAVVGKGLAFRANHVGGRALMGLIPRAVDDVEEYVVHDGEIEAGVLLGYNFGDGHLHFEQLLAAVQARCGFEPGQLRCIFLESQPIQHQYHQWRIVDAADGKIDEGRVHIADLLEQQPWLNGEGILPVTSTMQPDRPGPRWRSGHRPGKGRSGSA